MTLAAITPLLCHDYECLRSMLMLPCCHAMLSPLVATLPLLLLMLPLRLRYFALMPGRHADGLPLSPARCCCYASFYIAAAAFAS